MKRNRHISYRHCTICRMHTPFKYDPTIKHSVCTRCGATSKFSRKQKPKKIPGVQRGSYKARPIEEAQKLAQQKMATVMRVSQSHGNPKQQTAREYINKMIWDDNFEKDACTIHYFDAHGNYLERVDLAKIAHGDAFGFRIPHLMNGDGEQVTIPYHRVREILYNNKIVWRRDGNRSAKKAVRKGDVR